MKSVKTLTAHWPCIPIQPKLIERMLIRRRNSFVQLSSIVFLLMLSLSSFANNAITGNIFLDENENGYKDFNENQGIQGVSIQIFDESEILISTATSDASGNFIFENINDDENCRIEFKLSTTLLQQYDASQHGLNNGTFIQFVGAGGVADLALKINGTDCIEEIPTNVNDVVPWGPTTKRTLLDHGIAAVTCSAYPLDPIAHQYVFGLMNLATVEPTPDPAGPASIEPSYPGMFHHPDWVASKMGNVFGLTLDNEFNMYTAASSQIWQRAANANGQILSQEDIEPVWRYGDIGGGQDDLSAAGTIYKVDAYTGKTSVFAVLPQQNMSLLFFGDGGLWERISGPGLGNLTYDDNRQSFYVTNFEDGKIYHLDNDGQIANSFDPFQLDDGAPGMPEMGERIWGIDVYQDRVYFSTWNSTTLDHPYNGNSFVYSVAIDSDGNFVGQEQLEFEYIIQDFPVLYSPISDIEFNEDGQMLVAQRTMLNDATVYNHQSAAGIYEQDANNVWQNAGNLRVGQSGPSEAYGGAAWDPERSLIWLSSADINAGYGPHGILGVDVDQFNPTFNQATAWAVVPYTPPGSTEDIKGFGGDIAVANLNLYHNCQQSAIEVGNYVWEDYNEDGLQNANEVALQNISVQLFDDQMNLVGQTYTNEKGQYYFNGQNVDVNGIQIIGGQPQPNSNNFTGLAENNNYYLVVGKETGLEYDGIKYELTSDNQGNNELIDSDGNVEASMFEGRPFIIFNSAVAGQHKHDYDFGWKIIEPLAFEAEAINNNYSALDWTTIQEVNSELFEVERSLDQINWTKIDEADGAGISRSILQYTLNDMNPYIGINYYRIKWIDYDNSYVYSEVREVVFTEDQTPVAEGNISFPNPIANQLPLQFEFDDFQEAAIDIYRTDGALMWRGIVVNQQTMIDVSTLGSGTYIMVVNINSDQNRFIEKLVINN